MRRKARSAGVVTHISTLIKNAELFGQGEITDIRIAGGRVAAIAAGLPGAGDEHVIDAAGGALLPGLHDHHIHMMALAASLDSVSCGPGDIQSADELAAVLRRQNAAVGAGWVRGIGYHPCVAGDIDRDWLDRHVPNRPTRIQHRGGRLWVLNSRALEELGVPSADNPPGLELREGRATGRLYEGDRWLRDRLDNPLPDLAAASAKLASFGITGITDTTPTNGAREWAYFQQSQAQGRLCQRVRMMGSLQIGDCAETEFLQHGEYKVHLLESQLPDIDALSMDIANAHAHGRAVAIHCVSSAELVFALGALRGAGCLPGDRIEHASVASPQLLQAIRELGLRVVTQPHFIAERGDQYRADVDTLEQPWLYRCASFLAWAIPLAGGSDAPFGHPDAWRAMQAAVERTTPSGKVMSAPEALSPEQALSLFLSRPEAPGVNDTRIATGSRADLCLLDAPWRTVRKDLCSKHVRSTWVDGNRVF